MKLKMKSILTSVFLIWIHSLSKSSEQNIYLSEILEIMDEEEWMISYVTNLYSMCERQTIYMCSYNVLQGNITVDPIYPRDESLCCLRFDCFGSCSIPNTNCSNRIQSLHSSRTRQYLDYTTCVDSYKYLTENSMDKFDELSGMYGHIMVSSCPENASIEEKVLCENQTGEELRPIVDTIPVTANSVHFVNRHCASCHGEKSNYVFWNLKIYCSNKSNELHVTRDNLNRVIKERDDCHLNREPPENAPTLPKCQLNIISTCNESGQWKNYNNKIEELCVDPYFGTLFVAKTANGRIKYKNVFCGLCNGIPEIGLSDCMHQQEPPVLQPVFTMLISLNKDESSETVKELVCPLQYIFVPLANECMKTHCSLPLITDILQNTCLQPPPLDIGMKVRIDHAFKVRLDSTMALSSRFELEEAITDSLSMFNDKQCVLTFAYELINPVDECNDEIDGNFDVVYCYVKSIFWPAQHHEVSDIRNRFPPDRSVVINGTTSTIQYLHYEADPSFIADEESFLLNQGLHSIHNPYSKATIILSPPSECYNKERGDREYTITYMDCPSILLSLQKFDVERKEHGLLFKRADTNVPFSEFRSLNATHVYVCQKSLLAMNVASMTGQMSLHSFSMALSLFIILKH